MLISWNRREAKTVGSCMRLLPAGFLALMVAGAGTGFAQNSGTCAEPIQAPLQPGGSVTITSRSASVQVEGTDSKFLRVSCTVGRWEDPKDLSLHISGDERLVSLRVRGGSGGNTQIKIEVPRTTNLKIEMPAGEIRVSQVTGDKIIDLHAGDINVSGVAASDYRYASGSVVIGDLRASAFGVQKDGFFRSFTQENASGHYRLRVSVGTGSVSLE